MPATKKGQSGGKAQKRGRTETTFIDLLQQDHDRVRDIFEQIEEDEEGENRQELFSVMESELQTHMALEEEFFYPVLEEIEDAREKALESYEEHNVSKTVLGELGSMNIEDERWHAKFKVLQEVVSHHLQEEEKDIFKMAKKVLEKEQIQEITEQIRQQKGEVEKEAA